MLIDIIMTVDITYIDLKEVESQPQEFNNNNFIGDLSIQQYHDILSMTNCSKWIDIIHCDYYVVELDENDCEVLLKAGQSGVITQRIPEMYIQELESIANKIQYPYVKSFARLERCSLKDGCLGAGPFLSAFEIVKGLCTSYRCYKQFLRNKTQKVFITPWNDNIKECFEFRVFVYNRKVTAISQYNIYSDYGLKDKPLCALSRSIIRLVEQQLNHFPQLPTSYTVDVYFVEGNTVLSLDNIIEFNSFGKELAAGSCLFNWIRDYNQLYGKNDDRVEVRVIN